MRVCLGPKIALRSSFCPLISFNHLLGSSSAFLRPLLKPSTSWVWLRSNACQDRNFHGFQHLESTHWLLSLNQSFQHGAHIALQIPRTVVHHELPFILTFFYNHCCQAGEMPRLIKRRCCIHKSHPYKLWWFQSGCTFSRVTGSVQPVQENLTAFIMYYCRLYHCCMLQAKERPIFLSKTMFIL